MVLFANKCQNGYKKISNFQMLPETTHKVLNNTLCNESSLLVLLKSNFEVVRSARCFGGTGGKIGINVEKIVILSGLKQEIFQVVPDTSEHTILHLF